MGIMFSGSKLFFGNKPPLNISATQIFHIAALSSFLDTVNCVHTADAFTYSSLSTLLHAISQSDHTE